MPDVMSVNGVEYRVIRLLGKGKGGYSYLVERDNCKYVLKQIHHEPCDYYQFGVFSRWNSNGKCTLTGKSKRDNDVACSYFCD